MPITKTIDRGRIHLGLDVAKNSIAVAILRPDELEPDTEKIAHDEASIRRLIARLGDPRDLFACYEAGPTGYDLSRLLTSIGVRTDVVAPSLIPKAAGDRVKTDRRDARRLARLHRAGELTAIRVPTPAEEGIRDLCRARQVVVEDRRRARQRLGSFLLRHNEIYREQTAWTAKHEEWISSRHFADQATESAFSFYRAAVAERDVTLQAITAELAPYFDKAPFADPVHRLAAYRGIDYLGALTIVCEVCDFRRFAHAGNVHVRTQLVESAWAYQHGPFRGTLMARRQVGLPPETIQRSWRAQVRLCGRFRRLGARKDSSNTVVAAIARELAGFVDAEMTA